MLQVLPSSYLTDLLPESLCSQAGEAAHKSLNCNALSSDVKDLVTVFVEGNVRSTPTTDADVARRMLNSRSDCPIRVL